MRTVVPLPELAHDPDGAAALADDAVGGREPEAGAASRILGREERLEEVALRGLVHADAGVDDRDRDVRAGRDAQLLGRKRFRELHHAGLDGELAAVRHGIAGVHHHVHDDLLEASGVGLDDILASGRRW